MKDGRMNERLRYPREVFQWLTNTTNKLMRKNIVSFFWFAFSWLPFIGKLYIFESARQTDGRKSPNSDLETPWEHTLKMSDSFLTLFQKGIPPWGSSDGRGLS
jgi:hypothetical protein